MVSWYNFVQKNKGALMNFDERLEKIRKKRKLTFNELAQMINIHSTQLRRYEKGESRPTLDVLRKLAITLNVSGDMLLFDEEERKPPEDFLLQFGAISKFGPEEKKIIKEVLDGLILKHEAKRWASAS